MKIRKISASYIFSANTGFLKNGILSLCEDNRVLKLTDTGGKLTEEANLEHYNGILCPGFVNAHCHLELSHMLGKIPRNQELQGFIESVIPGRKADAEEIQKAISKADKQMREEGIVAVGDICNNPDSFAVKSSSRIHYHSFIEVLGTSEVSAERAFRNGQNLVQLARQKFSLNASITPHSAYGLSESLFTLIREEKSSSDTMFSIHNQESGAENDLVSTASGKLFDTLSKLGFDLSSKTPQHKNSLPWLMEQLPRDIRLLLVHNLYTSEMDIRNSEAENADIYWVMCPKSNFYIGGRVPDDILLKRFPNRICVGTDSLASNDKLSMLEELYVLQNAHPEIPLKELLTWSSLNGAKALGVDKWFGSFEPGKKSGVLLIENADIQNLRLKKESRVKVLA